MSCHEAVDGASLGSTWQLLKLIAAESQKRLCSRDWLDMEKLYSAKEAYHLFCLCYLVKFEILCRYIS